MGQDKWGSMQAFCPVCANMLLCEYVVLHSPVVKPFDSLKKSVSEPQ